MAVTYLFDSTYYARRGDSASATAQNAYRVVIGDKTGTVTSTVSELTVYEPGIEIQWDGDQGRFTNAIMGSALSFSAQLTNSQLTTLEGLLDLEEGDVFCLFFDSDDSDAMPYWYGHLMIEDTAITVQNERHTVDLTFTDGLASLRGQRWEDENGEQYLGFKKLSFYVRELVSKLPAYGGYYDYVFNQLGVRGIPIFREIGLPQPVTVDGANKYRYDETDHPFDKLRVRAQTFNKPKKQVDRIRELEAAQDYLNAGDVLEDICKAFGATACMFDGHINIGCRADIATLRGFSVYAASYSYDVVDGTWTISGSYTNITTVTDDGELYSVQAGATKKRTMPIAQVNLTHEEGGSDSLASYGYFENSEISHLDYDEALWYQAFTASQGGGIHIIQGGDMYIDGRRRDIWYQFAGSSVGDTIDLPFYQYPADRSGYLGFPSSTVNDLDVSSGEILRLTFGGTAKFNSWGGGAGSGGGYYIIGSTLIVRVRLEFTTTSGVGYRLSRTVHTHALTNGSPDYITIDMPIGVSDKQYFRKLYNDIEWLKDDAAGYEDDGWFEIIVPHGDTENSGDGYGSPMFPLTQPYGGQVSYAPIGTKIQGENDGAGVILESSPVSEGTYLQYFREDISVEIPYAADESALSFEDFYFEMGASFYYANQGPRGNGAATGLWLGEDPLWRSANADGTLGYEAFNSYTIDPDYIHFSGLRVTIGDGTESSDFTTKVKGGDGYEILNMGSSRLGSRIGFVNTHVLGTLWAPEKASASDGDFVTPTSYQEKIQWIGHRADEVAGISNDLYDSLHGYVADAYLQLFGKNRAYYSMTLTPKNTGAATGFKMLKNPFAVIRTNTLIDDKDQQEYLMPLSYTWTMNEGISGDFLKVGWSRDISSVEPYYPRPSRGPGGIVGVPPGIDVVSAALESKFVTDAINVDDATGDITGLSVKAGVTDLITSDNVDDSTSTHKFGTSTQFDKVDFLTVTSATDLDDVRTNYGKYDSSNNIWLVNGSFVSHRFTTGEQTKLGYISVTAATDLDDHELKVNRYAYYDSSASTQATGKNWSGVVGAGAYALEAYYIMALDGTGLWERPNQTSVAQGYERIRTIYYNNKGAADPTDTWAPLTNLWAGAALQANDSYATAFDRIQDFISKQAAAANAPRWTFLIGNQDQPVATFLLDDYTTATAAYSTRRLSSTYTGSLLRVRRTANGAEQDIGYDSNGDLDTTSLTTFANGSACRVSVWYDQSGSGNDLTMISSGAQPEIYNGQVFYSIGTGGGKAISFDSTFYMEATADLHAGAFYATSAVVTGSTIGNLHILNQDDSLIGGTARIGQYLRTGSTANTARSVLFNSAGTSTADNTASSTVAANSSYVISAHGNSSKVEAFVDGATNGSTSLTGPLRHGSGLYRVGASAHSGTAAGLWNGRIAEVIFFDEDMSSVDQSAVVTDIQTYFSI